jgi:hypothetical protein
MAEGVSLLELPSGFKQTALLFSRITRRQTVVENEGSPAVPR